MEVLAVEESEARKRAGGCLEGLSEVKGLMKGETGIDVSPVWCRKIGRLQNHHALWMRDLPGVSECPVQMRLGQDS